MCKHMVVNVWNISRGMELRKVSCSNGFLVQGRVALSFWDITDNIWETVQLRETQLQWKTKIAFVLSIEWHHYQWPSMTIIDVPVLHTFMEYYTDNVVYQATPSERCCMKLRLLAHATANAGSRLATDDIWTRESIAVLIFVVDHTTKQIKPVCLCYIQLWCTSVEMSTL